MSILYSPIFSRICRKPRVNYNTHLLLSEGNPCLSNPCMHNGTCTSTEDGLYLCNCTETGYGGLACNTGEIKVQVPQVLIVGSNASLLFNTPPGSQLVIKVSVFPIDLAPSSSIITLRPKTEIKLVTNVPLGIYTIQYDLSGQDSNSFLKPLNSIVMVVNSTSPFTNQTARTKAVILKEGCCSLQNNELYKCPISTFESISNTKVIVKSTCAWSKTLDTSGIVFITTPEMSLPVSMNGFSIQKTLQPMANNQKCAQCSIPGCRSNNFLLSDVCNLIAARSLSATYLENIKALLPSWFQINYPVQDTKEYNSFGIYDLTAQIVDVITLKQLRGCESILSDADGVYSALQFNHPLRARIGEEIVLYSPDATYASPLCFVVDVCKGLLSPLYIGLNSQAQMVTMSLEFLGPFIHKGWRINMTSLEMHAVNQEYTLSDFFYWNGMVLDQLISPTYDLALKLNLQVPLNYGEVMLKLQFSGLGYGLFESINVSDIFMIMLVSILSSLPFCYVQFAYNMQCNHFRYNT